MRPKAKTEARAIFALTAAIAFLIGGQGFVVSLLLDPVKESLAHVEKSMGARMDGLETRMNGLETRMDGLETRMNGLETRMDGVESKLDQLLVARNIR